VAGLTAARARGRVGGRPSKLTAEQVRQARRMYDARELTIEQIGDVLGVSRTSIYRALGKTTTPTPSATAAPARARMAEPVDTSQGTAAKGAAGDAPAALATQVPAPVGGPPVVVRSRGRSRWFVVEADPADPEHGPVAVVIGHTSQQAAITALGRARRRGSAGAGEWALLQVRAADQDDRGGVGCDDAVRDRGDQRPAVVTISSPASARSWARQPRRGSGCAGAAR